MPNICKQSSRMILSKSTLLSHWRARLGAWSDIPQKVIAIGTLWLLSTALFSAHATSIDTLAQFMKSTQSAKAHFTQVVSSPSKEGKKSRIKQSEGTFTFLRPNRFKFEYDKPFAQTIVADSQTLWIYDVDIAQVSARAQDKALGSTPASIIASAQDLSVIERDFTLTAQSDSDNLQWVTATPKQRDSQLSSVRIGLSVSADRVSLAALEILDAFGQKSLITFDHFESNPAQLNASSFKFTVPAGVEVIRP
jgi:outer membrane lipoprotein carrier protein